MLYITYVCPNEGMKLGDDDGNLLSAATRLWLANRIITLFVCNICIISPQITPLFVLLRNFSFGKAVSQSPFSGALVKVSHQLFHAYFHAVVVHLYRSNVVLALLGVCYCIHDNKTQNHHR